MNLFCIDNLPNRFLTTTKTNKIIFRGVGGQTKYPSIGGLEMFKKGRPQYYCEAIQDTIPPSSLQPYCQL